MLVAGVIVCLILGSGQAVSIVKLNVQNDNCEWGAQYWCSSIVTADLCGKREWCANNDWLYDMIQDFPCTVTQQLVKNARNLIRSTASYSLTQFDIALVIAKGCTVFEDDKSRNQCKELVNTEGFLLKMMVLVDSDLSTQAIATAVGTCRRNIPVEEPWPDCADLVSVAQNYISKSMTQADIEALLMNVSTILPYEQQQQYKDAIHQYSPLIGKILLRELNPDQVCIAMGLSSYKQAAENEILAPKANSLSCELCKLAVGKVKKMLSENATQVKVKEALEKMCDLLPSRYRAKCNNFIDKYLPQIIEMLLSALTPEQICTKLKFCSADVQATDNEILAPKVNSLSCDLCKLAVGKVKKMLSENATQAKVKEALEKMCHLLPSRYREKCNNFIDTYLPQIIEMLLSTLTPEQICTELKFCSTDVQAAENEILAPKVNSQICDLCKLAVGKVKKMLSENATQAKVKEALEKMCHQLPSKYRAKCNNFIDKYLPQIIEMFLSGLTPEQICTELKFCSADVQVKQQEDAGPVCTICELVIGQLKSILANNATEQQIEEILEKVCTFLPKSLRPTCSSFIAGYIQKLIQFLLDHSPQEICQYLTLCSAAVEENGILSTSANSIECAVCKLIMDQVKSMLSEHATQDEIKAALEKVCHLLPSVYESKCKHFIDKYEAKIIQLLLSAVSPEQICKLLEICSSDVEDTASIMAIPVLPVKQQPESGTVCLICEYAVHQLDLKLSENATQQQIVVALEKMCDLLPLPVKQDCNELVAQYVPVLTEIFLQLPSQKICQFLKLCSAQAEVSGNEIQSHSEKGIECTLCKLIMDQVKSMLDKHATQDEIKKVLGEVCHLLPSIFRSKCKHFIDKYEEKIIQLLLSAVSPEQICKLLKFCSANMEGTTFPESIPVGKDSSEGCTLCEFVIEEIQGLLKLPIVADSVEKILDTICKLLPGKSRTFCVNFVAQFVPNIIDFLSNLLNPKLLCELVHLCEGRNEVSAQLQYLTFVSENKAEQVTPVQEHCNACQFLLHEVQSTLDNPTFQEIPRAILYELCKNLVTGQDACKQLVDANLNGVISEMKALKFPKEFCHNINFCQSPASTTAGETECAVCKMLTEIFKSYTQQKQTVTGVEKILTDNSNMIIPLGKRTQTLRFHASHVQESLLKVLTSSEN